MDSLLSVAMVVIPLISLMKEFNGNFFDCPFGDENSPACTPYTGSFIMDQLGIPRNYTSTGCLVLLGFVLFYILTTWAFLQFLPVQVSFSKQVHTREWVNRTLKSIPYVENVAKVTIRVRDLSLWIDRHVLNKRIETHILQGIHADFEPGMLNVIMGPSGIPIFVVKLVYA